MERQARDAQRKVLPGRDGGFRPPIQQPRIPIWVAARCPAKKPFRRAARWDGIISLHSRAGKGEVISSEDLRQTINYVSELRTNDDPYDVANFGVTRDANDTKIVGAFAEVGATWWVEGVFTWMMDLEYTRKRIRSGPPRI